VEPLKDGIRIVVAGPPNAGKSSLINKIAGAERAIVTDVPGTTRDHIEVPLSLGGVPVLLTDTAGLRESNEPVEQIGIERARALVEGTDVLVWMGDDEAPGHPRVVRVHAQCDRPERGEPPDGLLAVSAVTGEGVGQLVATLGTLAASLLPGEDALALNRRQAGHLAEAEAALAEAASVDDHVLVAESLRVARGAFDRLTGRAGVENLLDALFGRFCLGK
jgi:tRNA modification GTPase